MISLSGWLNNLLGRVRTEPEHVTNEQILLLLDGEVGDGERRRIQRHLKDCWNCRFRSEEMQSTIHSMVECRNLMVDYRLESGPPPARALLAARLEQQSALLAASSHPMMLWFAKHRHAAFAMAGCAVLLLVTLNVLPKHPESPSIIQPIGARETLDRALSAEKIDWKPTGQVRHRSMLLRVRNVTKAIDLAPQHLEVWDDGARRRSVTEETGARDAAVKSLVSRTLPAGFETLRVSEFSKLVADPSPSRLSISRDEKLQRLVYQPEQRVAGRQPRILLASLDLRNVDLHPVAEELLIADDSTNWQFRLSEEADVAVPMAEVPIGVFGGLANPTSVVTGVEAPVAGGSLEETVGVLSVLDGAGALTQQDVQLQQEADGRLRVTGVVQDDVRRQALVQLLQADAGHGLAVRIATVAEQHKQPHQASSLVVVEGGDENSAADAALTPYLTNMLHLAPDAAAHKRVELENQLLAWSSDAESQAEALHEVLSLVPESKAEGASAEVRREWQSLVQHHATALRQDVEEIGKTLRPMRAHPDVPPCAAPTPMTLADPAVLISSTRMISTAVSNFVASSGTGTSTNALSPSFACLLDSTQQRVTQLITPPPEP